MLAKYQMHILDQLKYHQYFYCSLLHLSLSKHLRKTALIVLAMVGSNIIKVCSLVNTNTKSLVGPFTAGVLKPNTKPVVPKLKPLYWRRIGTPEIKFVIIKNCARC